MEEKISNLNNNKKQKCPECGSILRENFVPEYRGGDGKWWLVCPDCGQIDPANLQDYLEYKKEESRKSTDDADEIYNSGLQLDEECGTKSEKNSIPEPICQTCYEPMRYYESEWYCLTCSAKGKINESKSEDKIIGFIGDKIIGSVGDKMLVERTSLVKRKILFSKPERIWIDKKDSENKKEVCSLEKPGNATSIKFLKKEDYFDNQIRLGNISAYKEELDDEKESIECHSEKMGVDSSLGSSKSSKSKTISMSKAIDDLRKFNKEMETVIKKRNEEDYREIERDVKRELDNEKLSEPKSILGHPIIYTNKEMKKILKKTKAEKKERCEWCGGSGMFIDAFGKISDCVHCEKDGLGKAEKKNPVDKELLKDCNECDLYGECDHQGAYQKDGKWCYESPIISIFEAIENLRKYVKERKVEIKKRNEEVYREIEEAVKFEMGNVVDKRTTGSWVKELLNKQVVEFQNIVKNVLEQFDKEYYVNGLPYRSNIEALFEKEIKKLKEELKWK